MRRIKIIVLTILAFICLGACQKKESETHSLNPAEVTDTEDSTDVEQREEHADSIFVYVCGAVNCEGVYELPYGSRVYEAIARAGGFREDANTTEVNQAEVLEDEERIYVPVIGETVQSVLEKERKLNLNKASKEELMTLPGVGESRAESIIRYRQEHGAFRNIEDIMQVSGIKEGLFEKIKDLITV